MAMYMRQFFGKGKDTRVFTWKVSDFGQIVVERGGDFITCNGDSWSIMELLNAMLRDASIPLVVVNTLAPYEFPKCKTWEDVAARLSEKRTNSVKRKWRALPYYLREETPIGRNDDGTYAVFSE